MESTEQNFAVILVRDGEPEPLLSGQATGNTSEDSEVDWAFFPGKCQTCGLISLLQGDFDTVSSFDRSMGPEIIHVTRHYLVCPNCETEMKAEVQYSEYPRGTLQPYEIENEINVRYAPIPGMFNFISLLDFSWEGDLQSHYSSEVLEKALENLNDDLESVINQLSSDNQTSVVVLGSYDEKWKPELERVRDILNGNGYDAYLVEDLPGFSSKSLPGNASAAMLLADFCVLIDREPSGAIDEYRLAEVQHSILARLVPKTGGSTYQIGGRELVDINYIENFPFQDSPQEVLEEAITWAEDFRQEREKRYDEYYPWRED